MDFERDISDAIASGEVSPEQALALVESLVDPQALAEEQRRSAQDRRIRLTALGLRLQGEAQTQVKLRQLTEDRWYQDVRQFNGIYDPGTFGDASQYGSRVFVPLTRRLVNLCEARFFDMAFQSDQRFYVIEPTPVPELGQADALADQLPQDAEVMTPEGPVPAAGLQEAIRQLVEEARTKADAMQREIDDQLVECKFAQAARDAIHDAVLLGTGVLKGPAPMLKASKRWVAGEDGSFALFMEQRAVPVTVRVDLWNFFPDMSSTTIDDCEKVFERHFLTKRKLADLKNMPDVDLDALREILGSDPTTPTDNYRERLRSINGASGAPDERYEVWEYHGPITAQDLKDCGCEVEGEDPLMQFTGIVWFCNGVVFKAALNPLDSGELPYRVFTWQKDESSIFGFGLPYEVRDQQVSANSSWRAMLDNMGLCVMPQVVMDDQAIEPVNGSYGIEPGKFWRNKRPGSDARAGIQFINIDSRLGELQQIFMASKALIEEVGTMPGFIQGQDAPAKMQSATEASISWTAANLWVRRCMRNWDDDVITPLISGYYDWNMQYSEKAEVKGDSKVHALGISYLAELEGQSSKMQILAQAAQSLGLPLSTQYAMLREMCRSLKLDPDRWLPSEQELAKMKQAESQSSGAQDIEQQKLALLQQQIASKEKISQLTLAQKDRELEQMARSDEAKMQLEIADTAARERITQEEAMRKYGFESQRINAELTDRQAARDHKAQMLNAEMQLKAPLGTGV